MPWGDILLFGCAFATLACFGVIFCIALAEYRRVDPVDESSPWGDVIELPREAKAAGRKAGGSGAVRPTANTQVRFALHDGSATNR